jgi:hypothetical protein
MYLIEDPLNRDSHRGSSQQGFSSRILLMNILTLQRRSSSRPAVLLGNLFRFEKEKTNKPK